MALMVRAGFDQVFVGIESPNEESLAECSKLQNRNRDLIASVRKIQHAGLEVQAGFIVGFDKDPAAIFDRLIAFIQESGIVTAMVGLLNAPTGTKLYHRLEQEGRIVKTATGDNTDFSINFIPKMNSDTLVNGYRRILDTIYSPKHYYARVRKFLQEYRPPQQAAGSLPVHVCPGHGPSPWCGSASSAGSGTSTGSSSSGPSSGDRGSSRSPSPSRSTGSISARSSGGTRSGSGPRAPEPGAARITKVRNRRFSAKSQRTFVAFPESPASR